VPRLRFPTPALLIAAIHVDAGGIPVGERRSIFEAAPARGSGTDVGLRPHLRQQGGLFEPCG